MKTESTEGETRSIYQRAVDWFFGYDYFISYCWADGRNYAQELAEKLEAQGFKCFLDSSDYAKGDNWRNEGKTSTNFLLSQLNLLLTSRILLLTYTRINPNS